MANMILTIAIVSLVLSGVCFVITVVIFFRLRIREVYVELSGKSQAIAIARVRNENTKRRHKRHSLASILDEKASTGAKDAGAKDAVTTTLSKFD